MRTKTSAIIFSIKNLTLLKRIKHKFFAKKNIIIDTPEKQNLAAKSVFNYKYDCKSPRTFNEYLGWIKFNYSNKLWKKCADKLEAKEFLSSLNFSEFLPKTLGIYKNSNEINLDELPNQFVLKTNHDSGSVFLCNKQTSNFKVIFMELDKSLQRKYSLNGEWVYSDIKPRIFAEELISQSDNENKEIIDYKFFIYNGRFEWGFAAQNRNTDCRFCVFEKDFQVKNVDYIYLRPKKGNEIKKPLHYEQMIELAELIGKYFWFVRVDFYDTNNGPIIGELTFFSQSGLGPFTKKKFDYKYGKLFEKTPFCNLAMKGKK